MLEAKFIASGSSFEEALKFSCKLTAKLYLGEEGFKTANTIDIYCNNLVALFILCFFLKTQSTMMMDDDDDDDDVDVVYGGGGDGDDDDDDDDDVDLYQIELCRRDSVCSCRCWAYH